MFINEPAADMGEVMRTDVYNKASLVFCVAGMLLVGVVSGVYNYIDAIGF